MYISGKIFILEQNSVFARLFAKVSRPGNNEVIRSSSQADTCYYQSNHSKVEAIPLSAFLQEHNKQTCRSISTLTLLTLIVKQGN